MSRSKLPAKDFEWSAELAYAIGLLATDGNLSKDGQHSPYDSNYSSKTIYLGQIKATTPKLLRTLQLGEDVEREWGGYDALEPVFGLPLPPSPIFKTRKEADAFAAKQRILIAEIAKKREGRIKVAQPVKVKRV